MEIYTIKKKMAGTGSIHDIADDMCDRDIKFPNGCKYAVVLSSYYGGKGYTTHRSAEAAIQKSTKTNESHRIIDVNGDNYIISLGWVDELIRDM